MSSVDELTAEVLRLPQDQQFTLVQKVLQNIESDPLDDVEATWESEISHRIKRYKAGQVITVSGVEVLEELDRKLQR